MKRLFRIPFVVLATGLFLMSTFSSAPSTSSVPDSLEPPADLEGSLLLQELADWLNERSGQSSDLQVMTGADLTAAVTSEPRSFELFTRPLPEEEQKKFIEGLPYGRTIFAAGKRHEVDALLLAAIVEAESRFIPDAVSPKGAIGLMQLTPATGESYGVSDLFNPRVNIDTGSRYISRLIEQFDGDLELALAAYNAGPGAIARYRGMPPYRETKSYVAKVLAIYADHHQSLWEASEMGRGGAAGVE